MIVRKEENSHRLSNNTVFLSKHELISHHKRHSVIDLPITNKSYLGASS